MRTRTTTARQPSTSSTPEPGPTDSRESVVRLPAGATLVSFTITAGREVYPLRDGGSFEVGPISATVTVGPAADVDEVYTRLRAIVETMFQAEYQLKAKAYGGRA